MAALLLAAGGDPVRMAGRYERSALAAGELWRLLSAHLVHLGLSHTIMNVVALGVLAFILAGLLSFRDWFGAGVMAALAVDAGLYWLDPSVEWYVGLSGVLHGFWACGCMYAWLRRRPEALPLTALIIVKLTWESLAGPVPLSGTIAAGPVVEVAHLYGAIGGLVWALGATAIRRGVGRSL
jgi:rhomboid family GlyGly-CTERM serine protease